jgi:hypothetical protein
MKYFHVRVVIMYRFLSLYINNIKLYLLIHKMDQ